MADDAPPPDDVTRAQREAAEGNALLAQGRHRQAMQHFAEAVRLHPNKAAYHFSLACATWNARELDAVEPHFRAALSLQPDHPLTNAMMSAFLLQRGRLAEALRHSTIAIGLAPKDVLCKVTHADALWSDDQSEAAWELIRPDVLAGRGGPRMAHLHARMAPRFGREAEAVAAIERELLAPELAPFDRAQLHYAAAGLLDRLGRFDAAFEHARQANDGRREHGKRAHDRNAELFDPEAHARFVSDRIAYFTKARLKTLPRATHGNSRPVLIVGMPRSGTSLVEQILASHPAVFGGGELNYLSDAVFGGPAAGSANAVNQQAARYLDRLTALNGTATYVTDKMPSNFLFLGNAQLLLPQCHVIHCVRDARDTCLSCYFTHFATGNFYSLDLSHLAGYYRDYVRLMEHWKQVLTLPRLDVRYEDLIADPAGQVRRMLEFLGLPWDDRCLSFHQNKRTVTTASRDQVRRPIYSTSVGRWKHYEKHIAELLGLAHREPGGENSLQRIETDEQR
jgi:tetratricopeptide (TPR) repeat protein